MKTEVLIIGAGLAGATAAIRLADQGRKVLLIERESAPQHKVCGEFLSAEALKYLDQVGISTAALGAVPIDTVRLTGRRAASETMLPFPAMSLTRRCLDAALLQQAERAGVDVHRGCGVERLERSGKSWHAKLASGDEITADAAFLATGKHDLRGHRRPAGKQQGLVAFKMYWRLTAEQASSLGNSVELITYSGGYAGLQPVEDGMANLCCLIHVEQLRRLGSKWDAVLSHMCAASAHLSRRLCGAAAMLAKPLTIASLPYGFVRETSDGLWYLGDQAAVIPSFTGDGMSLALHTAMLAAQRYAAGENANAYQRILASQVRQQVAFATTASKALVAMPQSSLLLTKIWPGSLAYIAQRTRIAHGSLMD